MNNSFNSSPRGILLRRGLLTGLSATLAATALGIRTTRAADPARPTVSPDQAWQRLKDGHAAYLNGKAGVGDYLADRAARAQGQAPIAAVLSCADSRVPPELLFNQGPGGLFVVRVAGNVETAEALASLEYGTHFLGIPLIVVLGHSGCGAVDAAIKVHRDKVALPGHLPGLIGQILPAVKTAEATKPADLLAAATVQNVRDTVKAVATTKPLLSEKVHAGTLKVIGAVYDIGTGAVTLT